VADRPSRRQVLAGAGASALALSGSTFAARPAVARGVVYRDERGEGQRRSADRGIPGIMVSNGRDVTLTGPDGTWSLIVEPGDSVFVIKPPHWTTRLSPAGVPQSCYLYHPEGSPGDARGRFPVVEPTGALPASLDFPLLRREEAPDFEALLVSDTQPESLAELNYVRDDIVAAMLDVSGAAFGINHGDVVADDLSLYPRYLRILSSTGIPWHHCPGNHDINYGARDDRFSRETWKRTFGARHYAFQHGEATFFVLDNVEYLGRGRYRGAIGPRQLQFVRNVLARVPSDRLVVLSMHIPLRCYLDAGNPADTTTDWRALLEALSGHGHTVSFAGHLHATEHHYLESGPEALQDRPHHHHVLTAASGSWWSGPSDHRGIPFADSSDGTPNGFHVLTVSGNRYATRFVPAATKAPAQLRVLVEGPHRHTMPAGLGRQTTDRLGLAVPLQVLDQCRVIANVFDGGPRTRVTLEVLGRPELVDMAPAAMPDPLIRELFAGDTPRKAWVAATPSSHLWQTALPAGLAPGAHVLLVRARDEYGRAHLARTVLEVTPPGA
jgi:C terminal of Calcineurin-like phosphoesterase/Calcineurin-like phosphoesterase